MRYLPHQGSSARDVKNLNPRRRLVGARRRRMFLEQLEQRSLLAVLTWDGSANSLWSNPANWAGDVSPVAGDDLVFPSGAGFTTNVNDLAAGTKFNTILIQGSGYNITGAAVELNGGLTANNATGSNTFGLETTLSNAQSILSANAGTTLNYTGNIHTGLLIGTSQIFSTSSALIFDGAGTTNVTGVIDGGGSLWKLGGGTLVLSGANTYQGITDVRQGTIVANNNTALGSPTAGETQIQAGAAVQITGGRTLGESFGVREGGVGFGNGTDGSTLGALRSVSGANTITGNIELLGGNNLIGADAGSSLIISGIVGSPTSIATPGNRLIKVGDGTVQLAGSADNVFRGETRVLKGTLELNKTAGRDAIGGDLIIGDNIGGDNGATVRLLQSNQIPHLNFFDVSLNTITLNSSGMLDFGGNTDMVGNLTMTTGSTYSADIDLNGGTLIFGGSTLTLNAFQGSSGATPAATIQDGTFNVGPIFSGAGGGLTKAFVIADTQVVNIATDLNISASLAGPSDVSITRSGAGTLQFGGPASTYAGPYIWNNGFTEIASNNALGTGLISLQNDGNTFKAIGNRSLSNPISIDTNNTNFIGSDNLTFTGNVTLTTNANTRTLRVMDPAQTVTFTGVIGEGVFGTVNLAKGGRGTLALAGANTYSGTTTINQDGGTLLLRGNGSILNSSAVSIGIGGVLKFDNNTAVAGGANLADRLNDAAPITLNGKIHFVSDSAGNSAEYVGAITTAGSVGMTIELEKTSPGGFTSAFTANSLITVTSDRTLSFIGTGTPLSDSIAAGSNRLSFANNPGGLDDGIVPMGVVLGPGGAIDFATYGSSPEGIAIIPLPASAYVTDINQAGPVSNVRLSASTALTASKAINAILIDPNVTLSGPGATLTVNAGRLIQAAGSSITVTSLNTGNGAITVPSGTATISSSIFSGAVQKGGRGELILSGDNQTASAINVNEGVIQIQSSSALGSPAGTTTVRPAATLQLNGNLTLGVEPLSITGSGFSPAGGPGSGLDTYSSSIGALRVGAGNSTIAGTVALGGDATDLTSPALLAGFPVTVTGAMFMEVATGSSLALSGAVNNNTEVIKRGAGLLEYNGVVGNNYNAVTRVLDGTLLLNKEPGINAVNNLIEVGSEGVGAPNATLRLGGSDQIPDGAGVRVHPSGAFDLNGNSDVLGTNLDLIIGPTNAADVNIGNGGTLTMNVGALNVFTVGAGAATGSTITGGTLAMQLFGQIGGATTRTFLVNDGANGDDLTITSVVADGTGLQSFGINKTGFGTLVLGGTTPNTFTGPTTINEGTLALNKTAGVAAVSGSLTVGNNDVTSGFANSDVLELRQPNQIPDFLSAVLTIASTGFFDMNGNNETLGMTDGQNGLSLQAGSTIDMDGGQLTLVGNIVGSAATGAGLWTPVVAPRIIDGTLNLGAVARIIDSGADRTELPYELEISTNIIGTGGLVTSNSGTLLLSGNNTSLSGDILRTNGNLAIGSDTALGTGRLLLGNAHLATYGGKRTIANSAVLLGTVAFVGGNALAGSSGVGGITGALGGGGNDLTFTGPVNMMNASNLTAVVASAAQVDFAGSLGETYGASALGKSGYGTLILSGYGSFSNGTVTINTNGGALILRDQGTAPNNSFTVNLGGTLQIDNRSGANRTDRLNDTAQILLNGGTLSLVGSASEVTSESMGQLFAGDNANSQVQLLLSPSGGNASWRFTNFGRNANGNMVNFAGRGVDIGSATPNKLIFNTAPGLSNSILAAATITNSTGVEFASVWNPVTAVVNPYFNTLEPYNAVTAPLIGGLGTFATTLVGAVATTNVRLTGGQSLAANAAVNALLLVGNGINLSESAASTLTLSSSTLGSFGAGNAINTTGLALAAEGLIVNTGTLAINALISGAATNVSKNGSGTLTVGGPGANSFTSITRVNEGIFRAAKASAFGTAAGTVNVAYGATVELTGGITVSGETIVLNGSGEANTGAIPLRNLSGTNVWQGPITLATNRTAIDVTVGSTLNVDGVITSNGFNKLGEGTLQLSGTASNAFGAASIVWQGTVALNKTGVGILALNSAANPAIFVGDYVGGDDADKLIQLQDNQIVDDAGGTPQSMIQINSSGLYDLNGRTESFGNVGTAGQDNTTALNMFTGPLFSATVDLNGGTLNLIGGTGGTNRVMNIVANVLATIGGGLAGPVRIDDGTLNLTDGTTAGTINDINVVDGAGVEDLVITANIGGVGGIDKTNPGRLVLSPTTGNAYTGTTNITNGEVVVRGTSPLGTAGSGTTITSGMSLLIDGANAAEPLSINGIGFNGQGAIRSVSGTNTWSGDVTLAGASTVSADDSGNPAHRLILSGAVIMGANNFTKLLPGTLQFAGTTANTGTAITIIREGTLELNKTPGVAAIPSRVEPGESTAGPNGGPNADVLRWLASNQLADITTTNQLVVEPSGLADLNGFSETIFGNVATNNIFTRLGPTQSGRIDLNAGLFNANPGSLILGDGTTNNGSLGAALVTVPVTPLVTIQSPPGRYDDTVGNGLITLANNNAGWDIPDVGLMPIEVQVNARIANVGTGRILKTNTGTVALNGNNATSLVAHTFNLNAGGLALGSGAALGDAASSLNVTAATTLIPIPGGPAVVDAHPIALNSDLTIRGTANVTLNGAITNTAGNRILNVNLNGPNTLTLGGTINLSNDATGRTLTINNTTFGGGIVNGVIGGDVIISGPIVNGGAGAGALTKGGVGLVVLTNNTNSFTGTTNVNAGNLRVTADGALGGKISEQQTFAVTSTGGGSFTITNNAQTTGALSYVGTVPPTALDVETAINALPSVLRTGGVVSVTSSNPAGPTTTYTVTFGGALTGVDVDQITSINVTAPVTVSTALATPVAGSGFTNVANGATLQVAGGLTLSEPLVINNAGVGNFGAVRLIDLLPGVTETATWTVPVNFNAGNTSTWAGVDGGGANPDRLIFNGTVSSATGSLVLKIGAGEVEMGGATDNAQEVFAGVSGNDDGMEIRQGAVIFSKQQVGGVNYNAIIGAGNITIGDGGGGANADRLILSGTSLDQIGGTTANMFIGPSGNFSLTGAAVSETLPTALNMQRLGNVAGTIDTSSTRTLTLAGNINISNTGVTTGTTPAAMIAGNLALGATRNIDVNDSYVLNAAEDLEISAIISGAAGITKQLSGTLALTGANTYTGTTTVNATTLDSNSASFNNGSNVVVLGTLVGRGAGTFGTAGVSVTAGASLVLDNTAVGANRIADGQTLTLSSANFTVIGNAAGSNETIATLQLNSSDNVGQANRVTVNSTAGGLTVLQTTNLGRGSPASAEFIGLGADLGNVTNSRIQVTGGTNPFINSVVPWATMTGPAGFDLVTDADGTPTTAPYFLGRVQVYNNLINAGGIVRLSGVTQTLTADRTVDAILLENGATVDGPFTLSIGTGGNPGLVVTRTGNNTIATVGAAAAPGVQFAGREQLYLIDGTSSLTVSGTLAGTAALRKERTGTLTLSGDNDDAKGTLTGAININAGTLIATNSDALGTEPGGTVTVLRRAALVLDSGVAGINLGNKALSIGGFGVNDDGSGALRTIGASTATVGTGATTILWNTNPAIVSTGAGSVLDLNAIVSNGANNPVIKRGPGEMIYRGNSNTNTNVISVNGGTLTLNKAVGNAIRNQLTINDLGIYDDAGPAIVQYGAAAGGDQIGNNEVQTVTVPVTATTFTLSFGGFTTANLTTATATGTDVQAALEVLGSIGAGNVSVTGVAGGPYTVTFTGFLASQNLAALTGVATGGTGTLTFASIDGAPVNVVVNSNGTLALNAISDTINTLTVNGGLVTTGTGNLTTTGATTITGGSIATGAGAFIINNNEVQTIVVPTTVTTFTLTFNGFTTGTITTATANGAAVQAALEALSSIGAGNVLVTGQVGGPYAVTFSGVLAGTDVAAVTGTTTGGTGTIVFATPFNGGGVAITSNVGLATNGPATISGNLNLNGGLRTITVNDQYQTNNDLTINALVSNGRLLKPGTGALLLTNAANTFQTDVNQVQRITVNAGVTSFTLTANIFAALTTVSIPYTTSTPASNIQFALERLSNIQPGNVLVTGPAGGPYDVTFQGALSGFNFTQLTSTAVGGTITHTTPTVGAHSIEVTGGILAFSSDTALGNQRVIMNASNDTLLAVGNRTLANPVAFFPSQTHTLGGRRDFNGTGSLTLSGPISLFNPAAATQVVNLQVDDPLTSVVISGVVGGGNSTGFLTLQKTGPGTLQLTSANTFVSPVNVVAGILRIASSDALGQRTNELSFVQDTGTAYTLTFNGATTTSIPTGSSAATVAAALNALATIGGANGSVTVTGTGVVSATVFDPFVIEFRDSLAGQDLAAMTATGATVLAITRNGAGTSVAGNSALELQGSLALGEEFVTFVGIGALGRTGTSATFSGGLRAVSGDSTVGTGRTLIQSGGGNGQVNYVGINTGASLVFNGAVIQPTGLPAGQFTNLYKVGPGVLEYQGPTPNTYGTTTIFEGALRLNKAPGVNAIPFIFGGSSSVTVGDNVGAANSDQLVLLQAEQIPDGSTLGNASAVTIAGTGQVTATAAQAASLSNEVQQVFIPNAAPTGQFRLQLGAAQTGDLSFGASLGSIQLALNALATIGGVGGNVIVQGTGSGQNQFFTVTFLGSLAGTNLAQLKVVSGTTALAGAVPTVTTITTGGLAGHETIGAATLRIANQGTGNISLQPTSKLGLQGDLVVDTYGGLQAPVTGAVITAGTLELRNQFASGGVANRTFTVVDVPLADDLRIDAAIVDGAIGSVSSLNKAGTAGSRLVLGGAGANIFTGTTTVTTGILQIEKGTGLGAGLPDEVQNYTVNAVVGAATGQYTLTFGADTTAPLDPRATADEVAAALNALPSIGGAGGSVTVVSVSPAATNLQYFIRFGGTLAATDVAQITTNLATLAGGATIGAGATSQIGGLGNIAGAQTTVASGMELELDNVGTVTNEQLTLNGVGLINGPVSHIYNNTTQAANGTGALRNIAGSNIWTGTVAGLGNVSLATNPTTIAVDAGTSLVIGTTTGLNIVTGGGRLLKVGAGVLELGGTVNNNYSGDTYINEGTLSLNKQGAAVAIDNGEVYIGDNIGGDNSDVLIYAATAGTNQLGDQTLRIGNTGVLNLNGVTDTNNASINMDLGATASADVLTGAGTLLLGGSIFSVSQSGTTFTSPAPTVQGTMDMQGTTRTFDTREGAARVELDVSAVIAGGAAGLTKSGRGTLVLSGNNSYTGATTVGVDTGTLLVNTPATVASSAFAISAGSTLGGTGTINGTVTFNGVGSNLTVGGILNPGANLPAPNNTGILTVNNNVSFAAGSLYFADINGPTAGTQYDQLAVGGAGSVTITGVAGPTQTNTAIIAGTTGNGYQPVNNVDSFRLINKTSAGAITGPPLGSFLSQVLPQPPLSSPSTIVIGGKTYSTTYNVAAGLNDGNDFVLQAVTATRIWDGEGNLIANGKWSLGLNWVGDTAPFSGDSVLFGDQGNGREANNNDFVGYTLSSITFNKTVGAAYNLTGNAVTLDSTVGGITQTGPTLTNNAVSLAGITLATNPQTFTNASINSLLTINSTINGAQTLNLTGLGDLTFTGAIGGVTPLISIVATGVDDLAFNNTIATTGNVTQTVGTGLTTLSGGNVGGALSITTEAITLAGTTLNVVGAATLTVTIGNIADGNAAANNLTAPSLVATAITGIDLDTTIVDLTATNTGAGNVTIDEANGLNILGLSVANGNAVINALGALTDGATAITSVSGNGTFNGTTVTLGEGAGDSFNVGTLTFNSAAAVNITENSATQLGGTSTAGTLTLSSAGAITNAAAAVLNVTGNATLIAPSVTLGDQAGDGINVGTLTFTSTGVVNFAEDSSTSLAGTSTADGLILNSLGALTNAAASSVTVTNNASVTGTSINLGTAAGDTVNFGTLTLNATASTATVQEDSSLDLLGGSVANGSVTLSVLDLLAAGQNITLPLGATLSSTAADVTLNAGDNVTLAGNVSAGTTVNVNVDNSVADPGVGGVVAVSGSIVSTGGSFFTGNADNDTFTLKPQAGSAFTVNGNAPTTFPGDVLNLDLSATFNPVLTLGGINSGTWTFDPPLQAVTYISIEQVNSVGANYNLVLNTNTGGFGNTGVDDQILLRRSGTDFIVERTGLAIAPDNDDVGIIFQGAMASILSFSYIGSNDNDIVTVSDAGGLFDFTSSVPGVQNNPNIAGAAEFSMDGGGGTDRLVYSLTGTAVSQTYAIGDGFGGSGNVGEIETTSGGVTLLSYFTNVELAQRTASGPAPGTLSVLGDLSPNAMSVVASGTATRVTATGYMPFEWTGNNFAGVSVSGGQGSDTLELLSIGTAQTNPLATTLNGDAAGDTLRVHTTSGNTGTVSLNGGLGDDLFQLFNAANTVDNIVGPVVVDGTDGNIGGNTDTLTIIDTGDLTPDSVRVDAVNPGVSADYRVEGINSTAGNDVVLRNVDVLNYTGTQGNDSLDARFVPTVPAHDLSIVTLNGWVGADQFLLFTSDQAGGTGLGLTPTGTPSGVAIVNLNGDAPGNPNGVDGNDVFGETPPGSGTGASNVGLLVPDTVRAIRPSTSTGINIDGGQPTGPAVPTGDTVGDVFNVDISGLPAGSALILPTVSGVVAAGGLQPLAYTQIEDINLIYNHQLINVQMGDTLVVGTAGVDLIQFMRNPTPTNPNQARVRVNTTVVDLTLTGKTLTFGGASNDFITQANVDLPAEMYGEDGNDYISGALGNDFLVGGLGDDQINASGGDNVVWGDNAPSTAVPNPQDLAVGGDDYLSGLGGNDVFYGGGGNDQVSAGGGNDYANGGLGDDVLGGDAGDDRLYGGGGNDNLGGGAGNDLLSGGNGDDSLNGNSGNDIVFGGMGEDSLAGEDGNDLLVTGSVSIENSSRTSIGSVGNYDAGTYTSPTDNDAALLAMLTQWASFSTRGTLGTNPPITHDGVNDNVFGGLGDDDFCWEAADVADEFPAVAPPDFNAVGMGSDERFGPT